TRLSCWALGSGRSSPSLQALANREHQRRIPSADRDCESPVRVLERIAQLLHVLHSHATDREDHVVRAQTACGSRTALGNALHEDAAVVRIGERGTLERRMNVAATACDRAVALADHRSHAARLAVADQTDLNLLE